MRSPGTAGRRSPTAASTWVDLGGTWLPRCSFLVGVEDAVAPEGRRGFELLRSVVENADDAEGLPEALTHGNYHVWAAIGSPGRLAIVGWQARDGVRGCPRSAGSSGPRPKVAPTSSTP